MKTCYSMSFVSFQHGLKRIFGCYDLCLLELPRIIRPPRKEQHGTAYKFFILLAALKNTFSYIVSVRILSQNSDNSILYRKSGAKLKNYCKLNKKCEQFQCLTKCEVEMIQIFYRSHGVSWTLILGGGAKQEQSQNFGSGGHQTKFHT